MSVYEFGPFQLDDERLLLLDDGTPVALGPKVVETLLALIEHPGDVLTKTALLDRIWPEGYVDEANLAQNVYVLRKTLRARWNVDAIETIPRRGYRFTMPVTKVENAPLSEPVMGLARPSRSRRAWGLVAAAFLAVVLTGGMISALFAPHAAASARPRLSVEGQRLYEIGRYYWNLRTPDGIRKSISYFERVIDTDPRDARGYAALASADAIMGDYEFGPSRPAIYFQRARAYAKKALAIDPNYGEAYAVLGMITSKRVTGSDKQMTESVDELRKAIELDPQSGPAHEWYGIALLQLGRLHEAYTELRKAAELDPLSVATTAWLSDAAYLERRYDDAIAYSRETLDLQPQRHEVYETLGLAYEALGEQDRAIEAYRHLGSSCPMCRAESAALLAEIYAKTNRIAEAREQLAIAQAHSKEVAPENLAVALAAVGQRHIALSLLKGMKGYGALLRAEIANDPRFQALRDEPQVAANQKPA